MPKKTMTEIHFFSYLEGLHLSPLWRLRSDDETLFPPVTEEETALSEKEASTPARASFKPEVPSRDEKKNAVNARPGMKPTTGAEKKNSTLAASLRASIPLRSHFFYGERHGKTLLLGFLASHLGEPLHPLEEKTYGKLLSQLFSGLEIKRLENVTPEGEEINLGTDSKLQAIILFSREFENARIFPAIKKSGIPYLVLPHLLVLLRHPLLKAEYWSKLINILN